MFLINLSSWKSPSPRLERVFFRSSFGSDTPFILLSTIKVKEAKVSEYLEIEDKKDKAVEAG